MNLTHDRQHCETAVLEFLELKLGERHWVVGVGVPRLPEVTQFSRCLGRVNNELQRGVGEAGI